MTTMLDTQRALPLSGHRDRVAVGARLLDLQVDFVGDWRTVVGRAFADQTFDLSSCAKCVIGHAFRIYPSLARMEAAPPMSGDTRRAMCDILYMKYELAVVSLGLASHEEERETGFRAFDGRDAFGLTGAWRELVSA